MLAFPQWHLFIAEYSTEPVSYFPPWTVMLAFPQWHLFTAEYCTEPVTYYSLMNCHAALVAAHLKRYVEFAMHSAIMVMMPTPQPWYRIEDLMILGIVTRTLPCRVFIFGGGGGVGV